jgi:FtsZ-interacting cell division protein ZipA
MSDLQLSLLGIGLLVIAGVVAYNWWQERSYRKLAQQRFHSQRDDVLFRTTLAGTPPADDRIDPIVSTIVAEEIALQAEPEEPVSEPGPAPEPAPTPVYRATASQHSGTLPSEIDEEINYVARLELAEPADADTVRAVLASDASVEKPSRWFGRTAAGEWIDVLTAGPQAEFSMVIGALQLADRAGPLSQESLNEFCALAQDAAGKLLAVAQLPEKQPSLEKAQALDEFCADVDVLVGVNVVATGQDTFPGTKLRALAEAGGLKLAPDGTFQYRDERGVALYSLTNHESTPFEAETIKQFATHGITLLFDVPKVAGGVRVFDQMVLFAHQLADSLKGTMVDDNLKLLSDDGVAKIKQQLAAIYAKMDARGIPAGSQRALRLFS